MAKQIENLNSALYITTAFRDILFRPTV